MPHSVDAVATEQRPLMNRIMEGLPAEVRSLVYKRLDYGAAIALSKTCRFFYNEVDPDACTPAQKHEFLARAERFARYHSKPRFSHFRRAYACYDCCRILPRDRFLDMTLAEEGAADACRASPATRCTPGRPPAQGPLLPGGCWAFKQAAAYRTVDDLCAYASPARRACFDCHRRRGGWLPGQPLLFRGAVLKFCAACARFTPGPTCLDCRRCAACMRAPVEDCRHPVAVAAPSHHRIDDRYLEQMRRGLVHYIACERSGEDLFLDLLFDRELDLMPPYCFHPEPGDDARSISDIGDSITALDDDVAGKSPSLAARKWPSMLAANG